MLRCFALFLLCIPPVIYSQVPSVQSISELYGAKWVLLHEPGIEVQLSAYNPFGSLFEPVGASRQYALEAHQRFRAAWKKYGIQTYNVREVLSQVPQDKLINFAMGYLSFVLINASDADPDVQYYASDDYKRAVLNAIPKSEVVDTILARPTVYMQQSSINTAVATLYTAVEPVGNLVFTRDQQITTPKGVVMGRLNSIQRVAEANITKMCWEQLGVPIIGNVADVPDARLEGGDFIPLGPDYVYIGVGLRSNQLAIDYLLQNDLFGTPRVAVVKDNFDRSQDRMHLDTYFNVVDSKTVVMLEDVIGESSPKRRLVDLWLKGSPIGEVNRTVGPYYLNNSNMAIEFSSFLQKEGFRIIKVTNEDQLQYQINFVNLGNGVILSTNKGLSNVLANNGYNGKVEYIDYSGIERMYGAAHCTAQVFRGTGPVTITSNLAVILSPPAFTLPLVFTLLAFFEGY